MKKTLNLSILAVVLLSIGVLLYAATNKSTTLTTFSTEELADNTEAISSPPEVMCTAYVYSYWDDNTMQTKYIVTTSMIDNELNPDLYPEIPTMEYFFVTSREGTVFDCPTCPSTCSAYYELCDEYDVEYEY